MSAMVSRFQPVIQTPFDVRLMNVTAALLLAALLLAVCVGGLWLLMQNPAFAIQRIVVRGETAHNDAASLRERVLPGLKGNFFTLSMTQVQAAFQSAPWVERAVVRRRWPGLLDVVLQEYRPYARWGASGQRMIDVNGQLFDTGARGSGPDTAALPVLMGPEGQSATVMAMYGQLSPLVAPLQARLGALQLQGRGSWRALLVSDKPSQAGAIGPLNAMVELGSGAPGELTGRLQTFVDTAPEVAARHQRGVADIKTADLGYPNGYALRLRGLATTDGPPTAAGGKTPATRQHPPRAAAKTAAGRR